MNVIHINPAANRDHDSNGERGSALIIAVLVLALMSVFVALALSRTTTEAMIMGNDAANMRANYASQAGLETMTLKFNNLFRSQLNPADANFDTIKNAHPAGFDDFDFEQDIVRPPANSAVSRTITGGKFDGLSALQDVWKLTSKATHKGTGAQVQLTRRFLNNRIPIFQFGAFFDDDLELHTGTPFYFRGRVHTNRHFFLKGGQPVYFDSRISASGHIVRQVVKNGSSGWDANINICPRGRDCQTTPAYYSPLTLTEGSVLQGPDTANNDADLPDGTLNTTAWQAARSRYRNGAETGNLENLVPKLTLPMKFNEDTNNPVDYIQLIKRGVGSDNNAGKETLRRSRYFNKAGLRVTLSDARSKLPGGTGGRRLDGASDGLGGDANADGSRGYQPVAMGGYQATRMNGHRLYTGKSYDGTNRQTWIKIERVKIDPATSDAVTVDITEDILKLGLTEKAPRVIDPADPTSTDPNKRWFALPDSYYTNNTDDRSIIKLQRFTVPGLPLKADNSINTGFDGKATIADIAPAMTRVDATINFSWGLGAPDTAKFNEIDEFKVRWSGQISPSNTGTWRFRATAADGVRLWLRDGTGTWVQLIDKWYNQSATGHQSDAITLTAGQWYDIRMEYYESVGDATARLEWARNTGSGWAYAVVPSSNLRTPDPANPANTTNGLRGDYYSYNFDAPAYAYTKLKDTIGTTMTSTSGSPAGYSSVTGLKYLLPGEAAHAINARVKDEIHAPFDQGSQSTTENTRNDNTPMFAYYPNNAAWGSGSHSSATGGNYRLTNVNGRYVEVTFIGTQAKVYGIAFNGGGVASVRVDGAVEGTKNMQSGSTQFNHLIWDTGVLPRGTHKVRVEVANPASGTGSVLVDYAVVTDTTSTVVASPVIATTDTKVVPFPIKMFDPREGLHNANIDTMSTYTEKVPLMGLMSVIDIDMKNFTRYIEGDFDTDLSADAKSASLETDNSGWILYVSDRRGDADNDGEFDMENIYTNSNTDDTDQLAGEDVNRNGAVEKDYNWEGTRYREGTSNGNRFFDVAASGVDMVTPPNDTGVTGNPVKNYATAYTDIAAVFDHRYFRRGVRLINGEQLPYKVGAGGAVELRGFTLASENGVYVRGNYNAKGIVTPKPTGPSPASHYCPGNSGCTGTLAAGVQVPASIVADAVTLQSNNWQDSQSFRDPFHERGRKKWHAAFGATGNVNADTWGITGRETTYRMAVLAGDTLESLCVGAADGCEPNQGNEHKRMNGALHEGIIRFMEYFGEPTYDFHIVHRLNYSGSLINLFNSRNNTGTFKVQNPEFTVFRQPEQNNTFDDSFTDPNRLPPGTPFFQYVQATGFIQDNTLQENDPVPTPTPTP